MNIVGKKTNKILIGLVLGTAVLSLGGFSMSPKGKGFFEKLKMKFTSFSGFMKLGIDEFFKKVNQNKK